MTATSLQEPPVPRASAGCSSSEPLFSSSSFLEDSQCFSITTPTSSMSFDWSDFPVVYQYNEDMPVPPPAQASAPSGYYSASPLSSSRRSAKGTCSMLEVPPTLPWELQDDDDDTTSFSVSSDEDTIAETRSEPLTRKRNSKGKSVHFSNVLEIRPHNLILGSHPCCSGLALELGWDHLEEEVVDFDLYEKSRQYERRHLRALRLSYWDRRRLLEQSTGLTEQELLEQEQLAWREQLNDDLFNDKSASTSPQVSCSHEALTDGSILRKVTSMETLSSLAA